MSKKCRAYSESKLGLEPPDNRKSFYAGWDAALEAALAQQAEPVEPVAWRVRGYNQFKTGEPRPWRYVDGTGKPAINTPDCCDFEPLYTAPPQQAEPGEPVGYLPTYELNRLQSGHDGRLRSAKFGPSSLDGDVALYTAPPQQAEPAQEPEPQTCTWQQDGDSESGVYSTSCGRYFNLEDGTPEDNKMAWCCYCGKKLVQELITGDEHD